jgi:Fe-S cluster assembly protein SufD
MTDAAQKFIETYERERNSLPAAGLPWLGARRDEAMKSFAEAGLPHRRLEDWRYTDLRQLLSKASLASAPARDGVVLLPTTAFDAIDGHRLVFVNGRFRADLSNLGGIPSGVTLVPLAEALRAPWARPLIEAPQASGIVALNTALMGDGLGLHVAAGVRLGKPLHIVHFAADAGASHVRNLIRLEEGAEATIFETHAGAAAAAAFADYAADVSLAEGARLAIVKVQDEAPSAIHLATLTARLDARSHFAHFTMTLGAGLSRNQSFVTFAGEGAEAHVNGAVALRGEQHGDHFVVIDHAVPHCASATLFKTVLDDSSTGVFQGRVLVRPDAQKTDGRQMTNALLLSRDAAMNAKPELEIYADDVQCAHGSTIGELSREALFYLRSRGIDEETARQLLISAFLDAAFETVAHEEAREALRGLAANWFRLGGGVA